MSENTRRGYATDWALFRAWCKQEGVTSLPARPEVVAGYLAHCADPHIDGEPAFRASTIARRLAAINHAHFLAGHPKPGADPQVKSTLDGIRRERGEAQRRMRPLVLSDLRRVLGTIDRTSWPAGIAGTRDYALLLMGFAGAYRRSELAALTIGDVTWHPDDGLHTIIRRSKTDQSGKGEVTALPFGGNPQTCPPCAYARHVQMIALADAPRAERMRALFALPDGHICASPPPDLPPQTALFRPVRHSAIGSCAITAFVVHDVVRRRARGAGLAWREYGGHSLRSGFITQAFRAGRTHHEIMRQSHHRSYAMLEVYSRENDPLRHNAVTSLGL